MTSNKLLIYIFFTILIIGIIFIKLFNNQYFLSKSINIPKEIRENSLEYKMINPLIYYKTSKDFYLKEYKELNDLLNTYTDDQVKNNLVDSASIYFRDLNDGHWTGINEDETYEPSSMLKVILMISFLKESEDNPDIMTKKFYYKGSDYSNQNYKSVNKLPAGYYSVNNLIKAMISDSDNIATQILIENNKEYFQKVYRDFRLPIFPENVNKKDFMSSRSYSVILRSLYDSTYLSNNLSELALKLLSETSFSKGIISGVPKNIIVSHKFGENYNNINTDISQYKELHDCGIVYYSKNPYLICIMTRGSDFTNLENFISGISKIVYNYFDKNKNNN